MVALAMTVTPSPLPAAEVRTLGERLATRIRGWQSLRDAPPDGLVGWSRRHLERLADVEALAPGAAVGDTLLHFDIRADNVLIGPNGSSTGHTPALALPGSTRLVSRSACKAPPEQVLARGNAGRGSGRRDRVHRDDRGGILHANRARTAAGALGVSSS
jgi:hypothetical protein